jgi:hypothetical protein
MDNDTNYHDGNKESPTDKELLKCIRCSEYKDKVLFAHGKYRTMCVLCAKKYKNDFPQKNFRQRRDSR